MIRTLGKDGAICQGPCDRMELLNATAVFGGLCLAAIALCSTVDVTTPVSVHEGVQVIGDENVIGPAGVDPHAIDCSGDQKKSRLERCRENRVQKASFLN